MPVTAERPPLIWAITSLAASAALCLAAALVAGPGPHETPLLTTALAAGTAWLALEAWRTPGALSTPVLVVAAGFAGLVTVPAILLAADPALLVPAPRPLVGGLGLHVTTLFGLLAGLAAARRLPLGPLARGLARLSRTPDSSAPRRPWWVAGIVVGLVFLALFLAAAGGPSSYFANLDATGASTAGLTYLIWGVVVVKFATFAELGERWRRGARCGPALAVGLGVALLVVASIGTRLLLVVALAQLVLLAVAVRRPSRRGVALGMAAALLAAACVVGLGELRRWQSLPAGTPFGTYLTETGLPALPRTYVNQYADAVRVAVLAHAAVPELAPFEYGKELIRVAAQPIPGSLRPELARPAAVQAVFTTGNGSGNALPLAVIGYLQLGIAGALLAGLALGAIVAGLERGLRGTRDAGLLLALIGASTGAVMVLRGSLPQATAFALMDVVGFLAAHRALTARSPAWTRGLRRQRPTAQGAGRAAG